MATKLTQEEKELLESYETEEWGVCFSDDELSKYKAAANATFKKINGSISGFPVKKKIWSYFKSVH